MKLDSYIHVSSKILNSKMRSRLVPKFWTSLNSRLSMLKAKCKDWNMQLFQQFLLKSRNKSIQYKLFLAMLPLQTRVYQKVYNAPALHFLNLWEIHILS